MTSISDIDEFHAQLVSKVNAESGPVWKLRQSIFGARAQEASRMAALRKHCTGLTESEAWVATKLGAAADAFSAAIAGALSAVQKEGGKNRQELLHDLVDLWSQAEAIRALWVERYVRWPSDNKEARGETLNASIRHLGGQIAALCAREGWEGNQLPELLEEVCDGPKRQDNLNP